MLHVNYMKKCKVQKISFAYKFNADDHIPLQKKLSELLYLAIYYVFNKVKKTLELCDKFSYFSILIYTHTYNYEYGTRTHTHTHTHTHTNTSEYGET